MSAVPSVGPTHSWRGSHFGWISSSPPALVSPAAAYQRLPFLSYELRASPVSSMLSTGDLLRLQPAYPGISNSAGSAPCSRTPRRRTRRRQWQPTAASPAAGSQSSACKALAWPRTKRRQVAGRPESSPVPCGCQASLRRSHFEPTAAKFARALRPARRSAAASPAVQLHRPQHSSRKFCSPAQPQSQFSGLFGVQVPQEMRSRCAGARR